VREHTRPACSGRRLADRTISELKSPACRKWCDVCGRSTHRFFRGAVPRRKCWHASARALPRHYKHNSGCSETVRRECRHTRLWRPV